MLAYSIFDSEEDESRFATYSQKGKMRMDGKKETTPTIIMRKRWNDGHQWGRANHATGYANVKNKFKWCEHNTFGDWLYVVHSEQSLMTTLKFTTIGTKKPSK